MHEQFERVVATAKAELDAVLKKAQKAVDEAKIQMAGLSKFAEDLPHLMLDKTNLIFVKDVQAKDWQKYGDYVRVNLGGTDVTLVDNGYREVIRGNYRIILIAQKLD